MYIQPIDYKPLIFKWLLIALGLSAVILLFYRIKRMLNKRYQLQIDALNDKISKLKDKLETVESGTIE